MAWNERFRELQQLRATKEQEARIYERVTAQRPKRPKQWKPLAAMCSIVLIVLFLTYVEGHDAVTLQSDETFIAHMPQLKDDALFPITWYTNVTPYLETSIATRAIKDIVAGNREPIARVTNDLDFTGFEQSTSYVYVEQAGQTHIFEHDYMSLYDVANDVSYPLTEDEDAWIGVQIKELPTYFLVAFSMLMIWNIALPIYCKRIGREPTGIQDAPKQWKGTFYLMRGILAALLLVSIFAELVLFKGYFVVLICIDAFMLLYMRRFVKEERLDEVVYVVGGVLSVVVMALLIVQL